MKFVAGVLNGVYLRDIHNHGIGKTESVKIAVAYASGFPPILEDCWKRKIKVTFWGRYKLEENPITLQILNDFIVRGSPNYVCKLVPDLFHAKVIWWEGYGVYIGSANLTDKAWWHNLEAGIFFSDAEIVNSNSLQEELTNFFREIDSHSFALTDQIYQHLSSAAKLKAEFDKRLKEAFQELNKNRVIPEKQPLKHYDKNNVIKRQKTVFLKEWHDTMQKLQAIANRVSEEKYRPSWVTPTVPKGVQADQFLHAYYYSKVREGTKSLHWNFYEKNKNNPEQALQGAMEWWRNLPSSPHNEQGIIDEWAPFLKDKLSKDALLSLSTVDFVGLCSRVHALRDHSLRVKYTTFGYAVPLPKMNKDKRIKLLAEWLYKQRSSKGGALDTLYYVLWDGPMEGIPGRIFEASYHEDWKVPHLGISTIGEIVGWALPDNFPPRNGRTSKALTALGYDVTIHGE